MTAPVVEPWTQRWWDRLPELYRSADEVQSAGGDGWPLLRYLSLIGDQAGEMETLTDRVQLHPNLDGVWLSDLGDPETADDAWLPWMAQLVGVDVTLGSALAESYAQLVVDYAHYSNLVSGNANYAEVRQHGSAVGAGVGPDQLRQALRDATLGRLAASTGAWDRLIQPYLTGLRRVLHLRVYGGDAWHLQIETYASETPNPVVLGAVIARTTHAAGLLVTYATRTGSSYSEVPTHYATYTAVKAAFATYSVLATWIP